MKAMQVDQGTDAPKFLILNVVAGRPDSALLERICKKVGPEIKQVSKIRDIVEGLKSEQIRKGTRVP